MKSFIKTILLLTTLMFASSAIAQTGSVSTKEALTEVKKRFINRDVDYLLIEDLSSENWTIFVDAEPLKEMNRLVDLI